MAVQIYFVAVFIEPQLVAAAISNSLLDLAAMTGSFSSLIAKAGQSEGLASRV